ncbi:MAG: hypothetical protein ABSD43_09270, partial [Terracidiphilus sp.]
MKQFATWFTHGVPGGAKLRAAIYQARTGPEVLAQVERFFGSRDAEDSGLGLDAGVEAEYATLAFPAAALLCD